MNKMVLTVCLAILLAIPAVQAEDNYITSGDASDQAVQEYTDTGWSDPYAATYDCDDGWGLDSYQLTNSAFGFLTVTVEDCCRVGDYYEIWIDGVLEGTTPDPGYIGSPGNPADLSEGSVTVWLAPGVHTIEIRDALDFSIDPTMCPAGYSVTGDWEPVVEFTKEIGTTYEGGDGDGIVETGEKWAWTVDGILTNVSGETIHVEKLHDRLGGDLEWWSIYYSTKIGDLDVYTKGKTEKVFINWYDGFDLAPGETIIFGFTVSPDVNTGTGNGKKAGKQEYTSPGIHELNSGAWFGGYIGDTYIEGSTNSVSVEVFEAD